MKKVIIEKDQDGKVLTISKFNEKGSILTRENKEKNTIEFHEYDEIGNEILFEIKNTLKHVRTFIKGTDKLRTRKAYNSENKLISHIEYIYNKDNNIIKYINHIDNSTSKYLYDENENVKRIRIEKSNNTYSDYEYNKNGKLIKYTTNIDGGINQYTDYDDSGRIIKVQIGNQIVTEYEYDERGNTIHIKNSYFEQYDIYDENNHLIESNKIFDINTDNPKKAKQIFKYDERGNKIYTKEDDIETSFKYDDQNRIIYCEDSTGYWYENKYDEKGNYIYYNDLNGCIEERKFDDNNNLIYSRDCDIIRYFEISYEE